MSPRCSLALRLTLAAALTASFLLSLASPVAGSAQVTTGSLSVAVAANLKPAFEELAARFQAAHPGVEVKATFGASGAFFAQIAQGAPFDLFLSADEEFPARLVAQGLGDGKAFTYAHGRLVVWVPNASPLNLERDGLAALADPSVAKIAFANPEVAPYGRAAREALQKAGLWEKLSGRVVLGQSAAQAAQFVQSGNAQAGFVPLSLARVPPLSQEGRAWPVPASSHERIEQAGVVIKGARQAALARELASFVLGDGARDVLEEHGYELPSR